MEVPTQPSEDGTPLWKTEEEEGIWEAALEWVAKTQSRWDLRRVVDAGGVLISVHGASRVVVQVRVMRDGERVQAVVHRAMLKNVRLKKCRDGSGSNDADDGDRCW